MDNYSKYLKYKYKYFELKKMIGGANADVTVSQELLATAPKSFLKEIRIARKGGKVIEVESKSANEHIVTYNGNVFHIIIPPIYPFNEPIINGLKLSKWNPAIKLFDFLDKVFEVEKQNTLVYCHPRNNFHFLTQTWEQIFGVQFTESNKIYFDIKLGDKGDNIFVADGFSDEFVELNKDWWDLIMVPDCGAKKGKLLLYDLTMNSENRGEDAHKALPIIGNLLGLLKVRGKLWLTKTVTVELARLLPEYLGERFQIEYLKEYLKPKEDGVAEGNAVNIWYEITDISVIDKPAEFSGVIITRLL